MAPSCDFLMTPALSSRAERSARSIRAMPEALISATITSREKRTEIERDGFITSGDVGYIDEDGYVFISDRKRDMVISGGVNIYPAEIEAALHGLPGVRDCAVFGIPDDEFGEALMAIIEPQPGMTIDVTTIRIQLKSMLADYKVPRHIELKAELPREDSGKIFKRHLRDPYWESAKRRI
jgi:long-chain acyl-CoA synthetase